MYRLLLALLACSSVALAQYQRPSPAVVLFDAGIKTPELRLERGLETRLRDAAAGMRDAGGQSLCPLPDTRVLGVARGAFSAAGTAQTAYLLSGCRAAPGQSSYGLLLYQGARQVARTLVELTEVYGVVLEVYGVRDFNRNGRSELALRWGSGDGCCSLERLALLEWKGGGWSALGELPLSFSGSALNPSAGFSDYRYTLYVQPGARPVFVGLDALTRKLPSVLELAKAQVRLRPF